MANYEFKNETARFFYELCMEVRTLAIPILLSEGKTIDVVDEQLASKLENLEAVVRGIPFMPNYETVVNNAAAKKQLVSASSAQVQVAIEKMQKNAHLAMRAKNRVEKLVVSFNSQVENLPSIFLALAIEAEQWHVFMSGLKNE